MGHTKTTIELNGKIYNAATGAMLSGPTGAAPTFKKPVPKGVVVDGFVRRPNAAPAQPITVKPKTQQTHRQPAPKAGHTTQSSKTLMRHAVSKPTAAHSPIKAKATPTEAKPAQTIHATGRLHSRHQRAAKVTRSNAISRFSKQPVHQVEKKYAPLPVRPHPEAAQHEATPASHASTSFAAALEHATSHHQPPAKVSKRRHRAAKKLGISVRAVNIGAISLAVVLLTGFIAYQNVPNVSMRLASSRAGFNASLPGYTPSGFGLAGPIHSSPGAVTVSFRSHSDGRNFEISQKPSNWTSDSLLNNQVAVKGSYETFEEKGRTIYLYDGNKATWVNGGVWYQIDNNAGLSNSQIIDIADSL